ncbi:MAG: ribonuclease P protein component [Microcella sp.]|uniref:ribonuclease P protein component n=1 Tax=Microcella sp. TaxID=1913979 RepID=UPI003315C995
MLPRAHRILRGEDFRRIVRRGRRAPSTLAVIYCAPSVDGAGPRFGFIVSSQVGNAVHRNRVRRRLRAICTSASFVPATADVVIRALPGATDVGWDTLRSDIEGGLRRVVMT